METKEEEETPEIGEIDLAQGLKRCRLGLTSGGKMLKIPRNKAEAPQLLKKLFPPRYGTFTFVPQQHHDE
jgi:hypothetical protein